MQKINEEDCWTVKEYTDEYFSLPWSSKTSAADSKLALTKLSSVQGEFYKEIIDAAMALRLACAFGSAKLMEQGLGKLVLQQLEIIDDSYRHKELDQ